MVYLHYFYRIILIYDLHQWDLFVSVLVWDCLQLYWFDEPFFQEKQAREVVLKAMGQAISKTVAIAEIIKVGFSLCSCYLFLCYIIGYVKWFSY